MAGRGPPAIQPYGAVRFREKDREIQIFASIFTAVVLIAVPADAQKTATTNEITFIDLADDYYRQVFVDHESGQYLGHPTTCLLDDGKTILTVFPKGHGRGGIVYKRSADGGLTWSNPKSIYESSDIHLCKPGIIRSPDGKRLAVLLRENSRKKNSHIIFLMMKAKAGANHASSRSRSPTTATPENTDPMDGSSYLSAASLPATR